MCLHSDMMRFAPVRDFLQRHGRMIPGEEFDSLALPVAPREAGEYYIIVSYQMDSLGVVDHNCNPFLVYRMQKLTCIDHKLRGLSWFPGCKQ